MMVKGPSLMIVLSAENAIKKLRKFLGPVDPKRARRKHRHTLRFVLMLRVFSKNLNFFVK